MTKAKGNIWKGIIMLVLGTVFMLPVFLIVMNSFKTGKEILTNFLPIDVAIDLAIDVLPTPGGPTKQTIGPFNDLDNFLMAKYSSILSLTFSNP